jgi:hypothetical protein
LWLLCPHPTKQVRVQDGGQEALLAIGVPAAACLVSSWLRRGVVAVVTGPKTCLSAGGAASSKGCKDVLECACVVSLCVEDVDFLWIALLPHRQQPALQHEPLQGAPANHAPLLSWNSSRADAVSPLCTSSHMHMQNSLYSEPAHSPPCQPPTLRVTCKARHLPNASKQRPCKHNLPRNIILPVPYTSTHYHFPM